ncbi:hypothetical protein MRB53_023329 [Persea americana]|uniref:Uncharacterized protein n=1 Tax=Persea americana TaxID=3435 RepID=A0ACC2LA04_PERAE|nr:hypothetical protein MRB53_023329 [Persea americana]
MTPGQSLKHWQVLISAGNEFALGFFSPGESKDFYVAIWYNKLPTDPQTVVWVANRDKPIADSNGVFTLQDDGNLAVLDGTKKPLWSTSVSTNATRLVAVLLDSGNLVLGDRETTVWQSFDYPFDTLLPGMKIGVDPKTGSNRLLTSRKKDDNFRPGRLSFGVDPHIQNQLFIWYNLTTANWQSGLWNGNNFKEIPEVNKNFLFYFTKNSSGDEVYFMYSTSYTYTRLVMDASGQLQFWKCKNSPVCSCFPGFEPVSPGSWSTGNWEDGCHRKGRLQCGKEDKFKNLSNIYMPFEEEVSLHSNNIEDCKNRCLANCSCIGYSYQYPGLGRRDDSTCQIWTETLQHRNSSLVYLPVDLLYLRIGSSESRVLCQNCGDRKVPYPLSTEEGCGDPAYRSFSCNNSTGQLYFKLPNVSYQITSINPGTRTFFIRPEGTICSEANSPSHDVLLNNSQPFYVTNKTTILLFYCITPLPISLNCNTSSPCYEYTSGDRATSCLDSTKCCSYTSGDFPSTAHSVGVLNTTCSTYTSIVDVNVSPTSSWDIKLEIGWEPFHEPACNLMKDCELWPNTTCMPDGSIERRKRCICDANFQWDLKREQCISDQQSTLGDDNKNGRNLNKSKPSLVVVVLPVVMGSALLVTIIYCLWRMRIVKKGNEERILDVSLSHLRGRDMLDINNLGEHGKKGLDIPFVPFDIIAAATENFSDSNKLGQGGFGPVCKSLNLLGHAWQLWNENKGLDLMDQSLKETYKEYEVLKCICIGLLCVEEDARARPTMASVLAMLISETPTIPSPKQPAFVSRNLTEGSSSSNTQGSHSQSGMTISTIGGR